MEKQWFDWEGWDGDGDVQTFYDVTATNLPGAQKGEKFELGTLDMGENPSLLLTRVGGPSLYFKLRVTLEPTDVPEPCHE